MPGFVGKDVNAKYINVHALGFYVTDPNWPGLDGNGNYDTIILLGLHRNTTLTRYCLELKTFPM